MIDDLDGALTNIADHARLKKGLVRVAAPQLLSCTLLPQAIAAYRGEYPDIAVRLADCGVERVIARVLSGAVDFGIGPEREPAPQLEARELFEMPFVLVCPPGHPLAARERVSWKEIADPRSSRCRGISPNACWRTCTPCSATCSCTVCLPYAASLVALTKMELV